MAFQLPQKIKKNFWLILTLFIVLLFIIAGILWKNHRDESTAKNDTDQKQTTSAQKPALSVTVTQPILQNWKQTFSANGNIAAWQEVVIGSELSGQRITRVNVNVGDQVKRGQILAEINSQTIRADLASAQAAYAEAQAVLTDAITNNQRIQKLRNTGAISAQEATQYQTSEMTARARLDAARAQIESNQLRLSQTQVVAADNGVISARNATVGSLTQTGQELFRLIRDHRLEWRAEVTSTDLYKLRSGMMVRIFSPDPNQAEIIGKVRMIAPVIDPQTRYALVYVDLPSTHALKMGMFVKGEFELGDKTALTIPQTALLLRDGFSYVFVVGENNRIRQQKVTTGRRVADRIEVLNLATHSKLVASGTAFLADGDLVKIVKDIPKTPLTKQLAPLQEN